MPWAERLSSRVDALPVLLLALLISLLDVLPDYGNYFVTECHAVLRTSYLQRTVQVVREVPNRDNSHLVRLLFKLNMLQM